MRMSRTVHLEEDFWREMDEYKEANSCGSRNTALERMLLERRMLFNLVQQFGLGGISTPTQPTTLTSLASQPRPVPQEKPSTSKGKAKSATKMSMMTTSMVAMPEE